jgi:hypothetical protein
MENHPFRINTPEESTMKRIFGTLFLFVVLGGCATAVHGTKQKVAFDTLQGGGRIVVYDDALYEVVHEFEGELPVTVELYRKKFYKVDVFHPEFGKRTIEVRPGYNYGDVLSNLFTVTMAIDTVTGSSRSFDEKITIDMEALE